MSWSEHVHPHGVLTEVLPGIHGVTGSLPRMPLSRNMFVWTGSDGKLVIHSGICLDDTQMAALEALGAPGTLIVPNGFHRADAPRFVERYPELTVVAPKAARDQVDQVVSVHANAEDHLPALGTGVLVPRGLKPSELVYRVPTDGGHALVVCDLAMNHAHVPGFGGLIMKYITRSTGFFGLTGLGRWLMLSDGPLFADWLRELANAEGLRGVLVSHGENLLDDPAARLREAAARL